MKHIRVTVRDWEILAYRGALTLYVLALLLVIAVFPGVSNLWVTIFILVSGFFSLLADYASARRDRRE